MYSVDSSRGMLILLSKVLLVNTAIDSARHNEGNLQDYCTMETFEPQCSNGEVVVIEDAVYGRRHVGKCIDSDEANLMKDNRYFGCSTNVRRLLDKKCSGRKTCEVRIPDAELEQDSPCLKGLKMFLEVSYSCLSVAEEDRSCIVSVTSTPQHIARPGASSWPAQQTDRALHCGTKTQPWLLEAPAGQRIKLSLLDFTPNVQSVVSAEDLKDNPMSENHAGNSHAMNININRCNNYYGYIIDKSVTISSKKNVSVCGSRGFERLVDVYSTTSNQVELVLTNVTGDQPFNFLVRAEATGCTDLIPPEDAWIKRTDDKIIIGCYTSRQTWQLRCQDGRWLGVVSNCTQYSHVPEIFKEPGSSVAAADSMGGHQVVVTLAIGFIGLAVCLTIICCGFVCLQRFHTRTVAKAQNSLSLKYDTVSPFDSAANSGCLINKTTIDAPRCSVGV